MDSANHDMVMVRGENLDLLEIEGVLEEASLDVSCEEVKVILESLLEKEDH